MNIKKISLVLLSGILSFSLIGCEKVDEDTSKKFDEFIENEFIETMESDYTTYKTFIDDPSNFGIDENKIEVSLGSRLDVGTMKESIEASQEAYKEFKKFNRKGITESQKDIYDTYAFNMKVNEATNDDKYLYYGQLFESVSGLHYQIPTLLSDWEVKNEQDVKNLILLVQDVLAYINSAIEFTKEQESKSLLMVDIDTVVDYCQNIVSSKEDSAILSSMKESIDKLGLENADEYKKELTDAFVSSLIPAYENIIEMMNEFKKSGKNNEEGMAKFEYGKEYYEQLLKYKSGVDKSALEIKRMMEDNFKDHLMALQVFAMSNPEILESLVSDDLPKTSFKSYEEILEFSKKHMFEKFPEVQSLKYSIKDINEEIASDTGVLAYFNVPTLDGNPVKQLRVNPKNADITSLQTYGTVCHEGFPGHMYQYGYMYENVESNYLKSLSNSIAYTEGFAVYAQYEAMEYLEDINKDLLTLYNENELASNCLVVAADIGIHYEGYSVDEFMDYMNNFGFALDKEAATSLYKQLQANPAAFAPYYVGYESFKDLKDKAEKELDEKFNDKDFNKAILECGSVPFEVVERHVDKYISENK